MVGWWLRPCSSDLAEGEWTWRIGLGNMIARHIYHRQSLSHTPANRAMYHLYAICVVIIATDHVTTVMPETEQHQVQILGAMGWCTGYVHAMPIVA